MNLAWPGGTKQHEPNVSPPSQLPLPEQGAAKSKVPEVLGLHDVKLSSSVAQSVSTCSPSGSQVDSAALSTAAEGSEREFACEMELISVAEVRAEQQAAARETMLNLMNALQGALQMQKDLEEGRKGDRQQIKDLQACIRNMKEETAETWKLEERLQTAMERATDLEQQLRVLNAQAEDAKLVERVRRQKKTIAGAEHHDKAMTIVRKPTHAILKETAGALWPSLYVAVGPGDKPTSSTKDGGTQDLNRRDKELLRMTTKNHRLILRWIMTSWDNYVQSKKYHKVESASVQTDCRGIDLDMQERDLIKAEDKIHELKEKMQLHEKNLKEVQEERDGLKQQLLQTREDYEIEVQRLQEELTKSRNQAAHKDAVIEQLREQIRRNADNLREAEAAWDTERRALEGTIRDVSSQLASAIAQAKHMENLALRAKRNCSDLFRDQMAQMIADLEAAKHRLHLTGKERDKALAANLALQRRFGQKTRQIELERQFLPLIHHAQGPLGMRQEGMATSHSDSSLPTMPQKREKFRMTQGAGFAPGGVLE